MSKTYQAAELILSGITTCPPDIDRGTWTKLKRRAQAGALYLGNVAPMVWRTAEDAAIADGLAAGVSRTTLTKAGHDAKRIMEVERLWAAQGRPVRPGPSTSSADPSDGPTADTILSDLLEKLQAFAESPDAVQQMVDALRPVGQSLLLPAMYISVRKDDDQDLPLEVSFGATIRQKAR